MLEHDPIDYTKLDTTIENIRKRTLDVRFPELRLSHHFVFDLPLGVPVKNSGELEFIVMGFNPGETPNDWSTWNKNTEETRQFDFREELNLPRGRSSARWRKLTNFFTRGKRAVFTEMFFWSSNNENELKLRFGNIWNSPQNHLKFCTDQNLILIETYNPKSIVFPGLTHHEKVANLYSLKYIKTINEKNSRLVEHYQDKNGRPWFFTKHWTGSFGFSIEQRDFIENYIHSNIK
jgi:hypothetical protein